jgi:hypothetical protein
MFKKFALVLMSSLLVCAGCSKNQVGSSHEIEQIHTPLPTEQPAQANTDKGGCWQRMAGGIGASDQFSSGWLDLRPMSDFPRGTRLRLQIGGSAQKAVVRLLSQGDSPDSPSGIVGAFDIPTDRILMVTLDSEYKNVVQISSHGGSKPWGMFPLGGGNGPAYVTQIERSCP